MQPVQCLGLESRQLQFYCSGGNQTIRIVTEATERYNDGRGMMIVIGSYANTRTDTALNWKALSFAFKGDGLAHTMREQRKARAPPR